MDGFGARRPRRQKRRLSTWRKILRLPTESWLVHSAVIHHCRARATEACCTTTEDKWQTSCTCGCGTEAETFEYHIVEYDYAYGKSTKAEYKRTCGRGSWEEGVVGAVEYGTAFGEETDYSTSSGYCVTDLTALVGTPPRCRQSQEAICTDVEAVFCGRGVACESNAWCAVTGFGS